MVVQTAGEGEEGKERGGREGAIGRRGRTDQRLCKQSAGTKDLSDLKHFSRDS